MTLRTLLRLPRLLRHGSAIGAGLPPDTVVVLDPPPPRLRAALLATAAGDHRPARDLLRETRLGGEWENRGAWVPRLATGALTSPGWLDDWLAQDPDDPDAALVRAGVGLRQAWALRTGAPADVSQDRFRAFFTLLDDAVPLISTAAELNPDDPVPWQLALEHATGSQSPRDVFDAYWEQAVERSPHHFGCHLAALQYLCEKWHGSHREMFAFAERAAANALPGSKLHALPLFAAVEYDVLAGPVRRGAARDRISRARVGSAVERALTLVAGYAPGDPEVADVRNHLALMLLLAGRPEESLAQFQALGAHATEYPWAHFGPARERFLEFRTGVRLHVTAHTPFFDRPPVPAQRTDPDRAERALTMALVGAAPHRVAEAALSTGTPLRIARSAEGATYAEVPTGSEAVGPSNRRAALTGEDRLTATAASVTRTLRRPALVLRRIGHRYGFTLLQRGRATADHAWDPAAPITDHGAAAATAAVLARAYGVPDTRPLTALLRASDDPGDRLRALVRALGLPDLPRDFGEREDVLGALPDAQVVSRRGKPARGPLFRRTRVWWLLRLAGVLICAPIAVYAWCAPTVGHGRAVLATLAALYLADRLIRAWRRRPRGQAVG